jgi:CP family cyanate transporter-like MFS transporter
MIAISDEGTSGLAKSFDHTSLLALGCIWLIVLFLYILTHCISPLLPDLIVDFNLSHSMGGLLYALPILMIALFSYPLGIFSDRIGMEASIGYGAAIAIVASLLRSFTTSLDLLVVFTGIFGLGFAFCLPNLPKFVKERFPPQLSGTATGIYTTAIPFGTGLAIVFARPILAFTGSWRNVLLVWSLTALPTILLWWIVGRLSIKRRAQPHSEITPQGVVGQVTAEPIGPEASQHPSLSAPNLKKGALNRTFSEKMKRGSSGNLSASLVVCGLLFALLNLIFYCTIGWLPTYLTECGWAPAQASTATSFISFVEMPAMFLIPLLSDRTGKRRRIIMLSFLSMAICSAAVAANPSLSWFAIPVFGITMGGVFSLLLALPVQLAETKKVGRAAGAIISMGYAGALIGPPAAGYLRDLTGNFAAAFLATAFVGLLAAGLSYRLPKPLPTRKQEETAG